MSSQNFDNHAKLVPSYHYVTTPLTVVAMVLAARALFIDPGANALLHAATLGVALSAYYHSRVFPLGVQDRLIHLEERLRMERVLPEELRARIDEVTMSQAIGLRFASDEELPELVQRVLDGEFESRKAIKAAVKRWRPDERRV